MEKRNDAAVPTLCWDVTGQNQACSISWIGTDVRVIPAGTTVYVMDVKHRNAEYETYAREYGIHFIFEDQVPEIDFYTVPWVEIFAEDGQGGYLGERKDWGENAPVCYIDRDRKVCQAAEKLEDFLERAAHWRQELKPMEDVEIYASRKEAEKKYEFLEAEGLETSSDGPSSVLFSK